MKLAKTFWIFLGFVFVLLGIVGLLLPVVPQVPFFIVSAFCFSRGSERLDKWIRGTKVYQKYEEMKSKKNDRIDK